MKLMKDGEEVSIEEEMGMMYFLQIKGIVQNPQIVYYPDVNIVIKSDSNGWLLSHSELIDNDTHCYIRNLWIIPELRNKKIGSLVISNLEKECKKYNINRIELESEDVSIGFFEKLGFSFNGGKYNRMFKNL